MKKTDEKCLSLVERVFNHAAKRESAPAIIDGTGVHSYLNLRTDILSIAARLDRGGVRTGDRILVECSQDERFLACNLACSLAGCIFVGVESRVSQERLREIAAGTNPVLVITRKPCPDIPELADAEKLTAAEFYSCLGTEKLPPERDGKEVLFPAPDAPCEILFSTGTTGKSKGVVMSNGGNAANAENVIAGTRMEEDAVELVPVPVNHAHGLRTCYAHLWNGSAVLIAKNITMPRVLFDLVDRYRANALDLTPSAAAMLLKTSGGRMRELAPRIRYIEIGTAFLPENLKEELRECFPASRLLNFYGSSESGRACVLDFSLGKPERPGCIGQPVPNAEFKVVSETGKMIRSSRQETGLLACRGPMNMLYYWMEPELTKEALRGGFLFTKDTAYIDEDGYLYVLGRADDVINYKGIKISPDEIEEAAMKSGLLKDCACVPLKDPLAGQVPKLFIVPDPEAGYSEDKLYSYLKSCIDDNRMPRAVEQIAEIPRTFNGKIRRRSLTGQ